jgi:hypothetical protein
MPDALTEATVNNKTQANVMEFIFLLLLLLVL